MELKRRLYTRGSSYETTIPRPLLFSLDLTKRQLVRFVYDDEKHQWYICFEESADKEISAIGPANSPVPITKPTRGAKR